MRRVLAGIVLFGAAVLWGADKYQPLNVKLGLWETTSTITTKGQVPVSDEMLSRLTPEQRARVEERMKAQAGDRTTTHTYKSCLTKEKLERGSGFSDRKDCKETLLTSTSSRVEVKVACEGEGMSSSGTVRIDALSPESTKGSGRMSMTAGPRNMTVDTTLTSKWLGPSCGQVD